jgi:hypothetical protein
MRRVAKPPQDINFDAEDPTDANENNVAKQAAESPDEGTGRDRNRNDVRHDAKIATPSITMAVTATPPQDTTFSHVNLWIRKEKIMENEDDLRKITRDIRHCDASKIRHIKSN